MYDIIVVGRDISSLVAASLAVHRGRRTLLLEEGGPDHVFSLAGGYLFDRDPLPWSGLDTDGVFAAFLEDMGIDCFRDSGREPLIQAVLKDRSVDLPCTVENRCRELSRDFSIPEDTIRSWYETLYRNSRFIREMVPKYLDRKNGLHERAGNLFRELKGRVIGNFKGLQENFNSPEWLELKGVLEAERAVFARYTDPDEGLSSDGASYALSSSLSGGFRLPPGGKQSIVKALKDTIVRGSGTILSCDTVTEIRIGTKVTVKLEQGGETSSLPAGRVIVSTRWRGLPSFLEGNPLLSRCLKKFSPRKKECWPFTMHMGVGERSLPEMMGEQVILSLNESERPCPTLPFIYLNRTLSGAGETAPPGKTALAATMMVLKPSPRTGDDELAALASCMLQVLRRPFPFLPDAVESFDLDTSIGISRAGGEDRDSGYRAKGRAFFGLPLRDGSTPLDTVFLAGGELAPVLGFDGDVVSGITAARAALGEDRYAYYPRSG
ncbi:MAG: hypothetical protein M0Q23_01150 [Syntrophales bacterium]|jgi:phytoene dehydrogenase-like protein|nr:hypothetical protein [Syntrophales bacterium]MCK9527256.1 hypothetical protein [Syntrophales bacterium]MDX9921274.1 hypothetical protein [Syntrophales bacterium]